MYNNHPLISVVLPVYNVEKFIFKAIDSVLKQTVQDFEIIVIDDKSSDNTLKIVKEIDDIRIKIIEKSENTGLIASLNIGFKEAKGKYIARIDGDDYAHIKRFERQLNILENNIELDACGCWLQCFGDSKEILKYQQYHYQIAPQFLISNAMSMCSVMLKNDSFKHLSFDKTMLHAEDYDYWVRSIKTCKLYNIQEVLHYYRVHINQVSTKHKEIQLKKDIKIKLSILKQFKYNKLVYNDEWVIKVLFSYSALKISEIKLYFKWLKELNNLNKKQQLFHSSEFKNILDYFRRKFVTEYYFTNFRSSVDYNFRKKLLVILPFKEALFVMNKKVKERFKIFFKR